MLPTPLQEVPRLAGALGIRRLLVKRDDLTGLAMGGNKVRILEFHLGAALADAADVLIAGGGRPGSNHSRACAAAARQAGLRAVIAIPSGAGAAGRKNPQAAVLELLDAELRVIPELDAAPSDRLAEIEFRRAVFEAVAVEEGRRGHRPYIVLGTSTALGVIGYVLAAAELQQQLDSAGVKADWVVVTSQGATQAGLEVGARLIGAPWRVLGIAYSSTGGTAASTVAHLAGEGAALLGRSLKLAPDAILSLDPDPDPSGGGPSASALAALRLAARSEGLLLDPVYTAKGMAGLARAVQAGVIGHDQAAVFVHTGGQPALFELQAGSAV